MPDHTDDRDRKGEGRVADEFLREKMRLGRGPIFRGDERRKPRGAGVRVGPLKCGARRRSPDSPHGDAGGNQPVAGPRGLRQRIEIARAERPFGLVETPDQ